MLNEKYYVKNNNNKTKYIENENLHTISQNSESALENLYLLAV